MEENVGVGPGPFSRISEQRRQAALDAAAALQLRRSEIAAALSRGESCGAEVVVRGSQTAINHWMRDDSRRWRHLLSVRPGATVVQLRFSLPHNRLLVSGGLQMESLLDYAGVEPAARQLIAGERMGRYLLGVGPMQMKIIDRSYVLLQGPFLDGETTLMAVTAPDCLAAAWRYWHAAVDSAYPAQELIGLPDELTARQCQVAAMLVVDTRDEAIAEMLGVSVRTVRADIAQLMEALGVRSRFAAGARFREVTEDGATA